MRFMMLVKSDPNSEAGVLPSTEELEAMGKYNEQPVNAGLLLAAEELQASSEGARVSFSKGKPSVTDGPFVEAKELIAGYWMIQAKSRGEAIEWASVSRCRRARSRFARCSRPKTSRPWSHPSSGSKSSACGHSLPRSTSEPRAAEAGSKMEENGADSARELA